MAEGENGQISEDTNNDKFKEMKEQNSNQKNESSNLEDTNNSGNNSGGSSGIKEIAGQDNFEYLLFLILILLLVGNQKSFNDYFRLLNQQTSNMKNILNTFESTAEGLKTAIMTPQQMINDLNVN